MCFRKNEGGRCVLGKGGKEVFGNKRKEEGICGCMFVCMVPRERRMVCGKRRKKEVVFRLGER